MKEKNTCKNMFKPNKTHEQTMPAYMCSFRHGLFIALPMFTQRKYAEKVFLFLISDIICYVGSVSFIFFLYFFAFLN